MTNRSMSGAPNALGKLCIWLAAEICLSMVGLDDLADYSEFLFDRNTVILIAPQDQA